MVNFKKHYNLKIISIAIILLLRIDVVYASRNSLRVPLNRKRMNEAIEEQSQPLQGPFSVDTEEGRKLCYVEEVTDPDEMKKILDAWFGSDEERDFDKNYWEYIMRKHPYGLLLKLKSKGRLFGLAFLRKGDTSLLFKGKEKIDAVYIEEIIEVSKKDRGNALAEILVAKSIEKALNDFHIKDIVIALLPDNFEVDSWWAKKIGALSIAEGTEFEFPEFRVILRSRAIEILQEARNRVIHTLRVKTMLGKIRGYGDGFHIHHAKIIHQTIEGYRKSIVENLGSHFDVNIFCRKIEKDYKTEWKNFSFLIDFFTLSLERFDIVEIEIRTEGNLPNDIVKFIIENIKRALEDNNYTRKDMQGEYISDSVAKLKTLILNLSARRIEIPSERNRTEL